MFVPPTSSLHVPRSNRPSPLPLRSSFSTPNPNPTTRLRKQLASPSDPSASSLSAVSFQRSRDRNRGSLIPWRWSGNPRAALACLAVLVACVGLLGMAARSLAKQPLRIPKRPYDLQPYRHLDFSLPISLAPSTRIFHVTKEFGPATMGGLGVMLTALAIAQSESPLLSISVVLPHYSFLRTEFSGGETTHFAELRVPITGRQKGKETEFVGCVVSLLKWEYPCSVDFLDPVSEVDSARDHRSIDIYLVGPGDRTPFDVAFKAKDAGDVYSAYKPLKQEWKDLWFAKAAAELLAFLSFGGDRPYWDGDDLYGDETEEEWELGLEEGLERGRDAAYAKTPAAERGVDVVHLHGATNAMVAHYLREIESFEDPDHNLSPAIVYTLHDSLDEVEYSNLVSNSLAFLNSRDQAPRFRQQLSPYIFGKQLFPSALGIDLADAVTFVSESIARDIVEGRFQFSLRDLVMPSISTRAKERRFVGITNGLDFTDAVKNPFTAPALVQRGLSFPRVGPNITSPSTFFSPTRPTLRLSFSSSKTLAREHLVANFPSLFSPADLHRPLLLFIGRFQYNKGCQFFHPLLTSLSSSSNHSARLVLLGAQNNFPHASLLALQTRFPDHLTLIDSSAVQKELGSLIRMASDLAFVPSFSEAFGLVAAEALLFGMPVITTCVGGLAEFLRETGPRKVEEENEERGERGGNAYLFKLGAGKEGADMGLSAEDSRRGMKDLEPAIRACVEVTLRAIEDWRRRMDVEETPWAEREMFARRLVADALALKWSREKGPIEEYVRVYDLALAGRRTKETAPPEPPELDIEHAVVAPHIAHEGHDDVSGREGVEALEHAAGVLPVYKIWSSPEGIKRKPKKPKPKVQGNGKKKTKVG